MTLHHEPIMLGVPTLLAVLCYVVAVLCLYLHKLVDKVRSTVRSYSPPGEGGGVGQRGVNRYGVHIGVGPSTARRVLPLLLLLGIAVLVLTGCPSADSPKNYPHLEQSWRRCVVMVTTAGHDGAGDIKCWRSEKVARTVADGAHLWVGGIEVAVPHALVACGAEQSWQELADAISLPKVQLCEGAK
jgi:hypothetical protein